MDAAAGDASLNFLKRGSLAQAVQDDGVCCGAGLVGVHAPILAHDARERRTLPGRVGGQSALMPARYAETA
jgi:hypothetical protein